MFSANSSLLISFFHTRILHGRLRKRWRDGQVLGDESSMGTVQRLGPICALNVITQIAFQIIPVSEW